MPRIPEGGAGGLGALHDAPVCGRPAERCAVVLRVRTARRSACEGRWERARSPTLPTPTWRSTARSSAGHGDGRARRGRDVGEWDLTFDDGLPAFRHLHPDWLYAAPLPRTKVETLHPASTFAGWVNVGGQVVDVTGWRGMVGHNWGAEHAEEWVWLQGNDIGVAGCHLDVAADGFLVGGRLTPWVANGVLVSTGRRCGSAASGD